MICLTGSDNISDEIAAEFGFIVSRLTCLVDDLFVSVRSHDLIYRSEV